MQFLLKSAGLNYVMQVEVIRFTSPNGPPNGPLNEKEKKLPKILNSQWFPKEQPNAMDPQITPNKNPY